MSIDLVELQEMKKRVCQANLDLKKSHLVVLTWGNVSEINREEGIVVIKPSGVAYDQMTPDQMVVTDLKGHTLETNSLNPSSDLATHLYLYDHFPTIKSVVHTHSKYAVMWAQAGRDIPPYGTTHADTFYGAIPVTRQLNQTEVEAAYELNTGHVIVETFDSRGLDYEAIPGVMAVGHGPFTWGDSCQKAVENSIVLDEVAHMAIYTELLNSAHKQIPSYLLDKHYYRKHGKHAYYGQNT